MAVCILLGVLGGKYLDQWLGTSPALLLVCSLLGIGAAYKVLFDLVKKWMK